MNAADNYTLLRGQTNQKVQLTASNEEIKAIIKQRELTISQLSKSIEARRAEMKLQSKKISSILEKQAKKRQKEVPQFGANHLSSHLRAIYAQLQEVYKKSEEVKKEIGELKEEQPQQIVKETQKNKSILSMLERSISQTQRNKQLLLAELAANKQRIQSLKNNSCLIDLEAREKQYQDLKKQCKHYEKQITIINADSLPLDHFYYQLRQRLQRQFIRDTKDIAAGDQHQIHTLIQEINQIVQQRNIIEKNSGLKVKQLLQEINDIQKKNKEVQKKIRQCHNEVLRSELNNRRVTSYNTEPNKAATLIAKPLRKVNPEVGISSRKKMVNKVYMMQREQEKSIVVGEWVTDGKIYCDRGQSWQILVEKARKILFLISNEELVGIRAIYGDKNGSLLQGRTLLAPDIYSYSETVVSLDDLSSVQYAPRGNQIYLKFMGTHGTKEIGNKKDQNQSQLQRISLDQYFIKWIQVQLSHKVAAIRLSLEDKPIEEKIIAEEVEEKAPATQRSFSNSTLGPRRVLLKGRSLTKLKQEPIVDHRLLLVKTKMV